MSTVIILCLIGMMLILASTIIKLCVLKREDKLLYLKSFRKGKCFLIYIVAVPLFWLGIYYNETPLGYALLKAIKASVDLVVLKIDYASVQKLVNDNLLYAVAMGICFALVVLNAALFTITIFWQRLVNQYYGYKATHYSKKIYVIVGLNDKNITIMKSIDSTKNSVIFLADKLTDEACLFAYNKKIAIQKFQKGEDLGAKLIKLFRNDFTQKSVNVIINTENDEVNLLYVEQLSEIITNLNLVELACDEPKGMNVFVLGEPENSSSFIHFVQKTKGSIRYVNKYKLIAIDFAQNYPITEFMTDEHIDFETGTIKENIDINFVMIGFGKTNQQVFLTFVANNQLMTLKQGVFVDKPVHYWLFDKNDSQNDKNLNHTFFRYENECCSIRKSDYLPLPAKPALVDFLKLDINDTKFYESIRGSLKKKEKQQTSYNYVVVAFGNDLENLDLSDKLLTKLKEWQLEQNTRLFVKIRDGKLARNVIKKEYFVDGKFMTFGLEDEAVYNLEQITAEKIEFMARDRHLTYSLCDKTLEQIDINSVGKNKIDEYSVKKKAIEKWYQWYSVQRESNIYACLSIRMKLQLLGFDYCKIDEKKDKEACENDYLLAYEKNDPICYMDEVGTIAGKRIVKYTNNYVEGSIRQFLAIQEHQRWNAYMICSGIIPSSKEEILEEGSKNLGLRRHGNITTFSGLVEYRKMISDKNNESEENTDVIRYDYQLMDDLVWLLNKNGYKIIKK